MTLQEIVEALSLTVMDAPDKLERSVTGGYASDLFSSVMARAQAGNVWVTVQSHANVVAVASLMDLAAVIITEGNIPDPDALSKADEVGIPILTTPLTTFTVVGRLAALGVEGEAKR